MEKANIFASPVSTVIAGREFTFSPLTVQDFGQLEREAEMYYRKQLLDLLTYQANQQADPQVRQRMIDQAMAQAMDSRPPKKRIKIPRRENGVLLRDDQGNPIEQEQEGDYSWWWVTEVMEGQLAMIHLSASKRSKMSKAEVAEALDQGGLDAYVRAIEVVGELSNATVGNEATPGELEEARRAMKRAEALASGTQEIRSSGGESSSSSAPTNGESSSEAPTTSLIAP